MMISKSYILFCGFLLTLFSGCDKWTDNADAPNDALSFEQLAKPVMLAGLQDKTISDGSLTANVKTLAGEAAAQAFIALGAMTDEVQATKVPNSLLYKQLQDDDITSNSGSQDGLWNSLQNFRARAEELLDIEQKIPADAWGHNLAAAGYTRYIGHLYTAYAYYLLKQCFAALPQEEGGVPADGKKMDATALNRCIEEHLQAALQESRAESLQELTGAFIPGRATRIAESLLVKYYVGKNDFKQALEHLDKALHPEERFEIVYSGEGKENLIYSTLGPNARNAEISQSLVESLRNTAEQKAVPTLLSKKEKNRYLANVQKYSPVIITDGKEMALVKAEILLRNKTPEDAEKATAEVNRIVTQLDEASQTHTPLSLDDLAHIRRVYLLLRGERISDYRRGMVNASQKEWWSNRKNHWIPLPEIELNY